MSLLDMLVHSFSCDFLLPLCVRSSDFSSSKYFRNAVAGQVVCSELLKGFFLGQRVVSWESCWKGLVSGLPVVKRSSWNACFFRPPAPLFVRRHGPTFVARIWPQICGRFLGFRRNPGVHGDEGLVLVPGNWPHCVGPLFQTKRGHGVKKNMHVPHQTHQWNNSLVCGLLERGGVEGFTR